MKIHHLALAAILPLAACNSNAMNPMAATVPVPMASPAITAQDQSFAMQAANSDMFEIQSSQLALQKSRSPRIRRFAQKMIDDHTQTSSQLNTLATQKGIPLPQQLDPALQQKMAVLQAANRTFDREYLADQVAGHQMAEQNLQTEIANGTAPDMKTLAQNTLPIVQQHLQMARTMTTR